MSSSEHYYRNQIYTTKNLKDCRRDKTFYPKVSDLPGSILYEQALQAESRDNGYPIIKRPPNGKVCLFLFLLSIKMTDILTLKKNWTFCSSVPDSVETNRFRDNNRIVDFVLAYSDDGSPRKKRRRKAYHKSLIEEGLELEIEDKKDSESGQMYFVKVHAPWEILTRYAEILKLKKPVKV
ncbi:hypothetical protein Avbf_09926 [Armadillidium vulgare]|nr:hypothetical protein Avbf_09926 [Armadillidium vulgare]